MEDQTKGYQTIGGAMLVCASCDAVQAMAATGGVPSQCERCGAAFGATDAGLKAVGHEAELEHYEIDCPQCAAHYVLDLEPGDVVFDCERCGCAFVVGDATADDQPEPAGAEVPTYTQAMQAAAAGGRKQRQRAHRRPGGGLKSRAGGISLLVITLAVVGLFSWDAVRDYQLKQDEVARAREARAAAAAGAAAGESEVEAGFRVFGPEISQRGVVAGALTGILEADDFEARLDLCRHPLETRNRMQAFERYGRLPGAEGKEVLVEAGPYLVVAPNGSQYLYSLIDLGEDTPRHLVVELTQDGRHLIEWELLVNFSQFPWAQLEEERPQRAFEALVKVERSSRYPRQFPPDKYASYLVYQGSGIESFAVFLERGSDQHQALEAAFEADPFPLVDDTGRRKSRWVLGEFVFPSEPDPGLKRLLLRRVAVPDAVAALRD